VYTELVEMDKLMWFVVKELLLPKYLKEIEGDLILKNYIFILMNKS